MPVWRRTHIHRQYRHPVTLRAIGIAQEATEAVPAQTTQDAVMHIMTFSTKNGLADADRIVSIVRDQHVEMLALQEVSASLIKRLTAVGIDGLLPSRAFGAAGSNDNGGINVLYTLAPMSDVSDSIVPVTGSAVLACTITAGLYAVRLVSVHSSFSKAGACGFLNESLRNLSLLREYDDEYLVMGDFNVAWDHSRYRKMMGDILVDASQQAGAGFYMTYPSEPGYAMLPAPRMMEVDHVVYSKNSGISTGNLESAKVDGADRSTLLGVWVVK